MKNSLVLVIKLSLFIFVIVSYVSISFITIVLHSFKMPKARFFLRYYISIVGRLGLIIFGVKLTIRGRDQFKNRAKMIISNHLGYLDILIIASLYPSIFVTSKEMRESKILGELCFLGGCHFVERRSPKHLVREIKEIAKTLAQKMNVVLFPEATSTDGSRVIEFKKSLFEVGFKNKELFLPICLNYKKLDEEKITSANRDNVFWYGEMPFFPHAINLLKRKSLEVEVTIFECLDSNEFANRNDLADKAYALISKDYEKIN